MDASSYLAATADLLVGAVCVGCRRAGLPLCSGCGRRLQGLPHPTAPDPLPTGLPPVFAITSYDGVAKAVLLGHKEEGCLALARPLGRALALSCFAVLATAARTPAPVHLVPVPSTRIKVCERGYDPLLRAARECRKAMRSAGVVSAVRPVLTVARPVEDQSGLSARARHDNLRAAFGVRGHRSLDGIAIIVVDDIITTGATAVEATRALTVAGADVLGVAVVAATARRGR